MIHDPRECYVCKRALEEDEGEEFCPFQLPELPDYPVLVCSVCELSEKHQNNAHYTSCNHAAEESHQEWCAEQGYNEE